MSHASQTFEPRPSAAPSAALPSIHSHLALAIGFATSLVIGVGGWAHMTMISGAVIAAGQLVVESDVKKIQHPTGGVVSQLLVRDGARVKAGDVLIRLDATQTRANLEIVLKALDELAARRARDEAERDGTAEIVFPADLLARRQGDPAVAHLMDGESRLFHARLAARRGQKAQLRERTSQLREETKGQGEQATAKSEEITLIWSELKGVRDLYAKNLIPLSRLTALERETTRLQGERGQLMAATASTKGKITEIALQILQIDQDMHSEVGKDIAEIRAKWSEYVERRVAAEDQLKRVDMRSPQDGTVHQMTVHTIGGLVSPSEPAMLIVPDADRLTVEIRIQPQDIDSVRVNQAAVLRFAAFNQRVTPEIDGVVTRVSADVAQDAKTGMAFYLARIGITPHQKDRLGGVRLMPGMPVEAYVRLDDRSVISYLTKPLADQIAKAWRER